MADGPKQSKSNEPTSAKPGVEETHVAAVASTNREAPFSSGTELFSLGCELAGALGTVDRQEVDEATSEMREQGASANTRRSYRTALEYWHAWHGLRFGARLVMPLSGAIVETFIADHVLRISARTAALATTLPPNVDLELVRLSFKAHAGPLALSTVLHRLSVVSWAHQELKLANPLAMPEIRSLIASARKTAAKSGQSIVKKKPPITRDVLLQLLATCDNESPHGVRDRALLLFAFSTGGRRRSEVCDALFTRLERRGDAAFIYTMGATKTNQTGQDDPNSAKPIAGSAAAALTRWLEMSQIDAGYLFRSIDRFGRVSDEKLSDQTVNKIVKERAQLAGLSKDYSAHSLRSGFVTEAGRRDIPIAEGMALTGHRSFAAYTGYHRSGASLESPASRLADD